jgi:hypothetical protein
MQFGDNWSSTSTQNIKDRATGNPLTTVGVPEGQAVADTHVVPVVISEPTGNQALLISISFSTSSKMAIIGTAPFRLTGKNQQLFKGSLICA